MEVKVEITNGCTVCRPVGSLDRSNGPKLREVMALMTSVRRLVIDLSDVPFVDSAALGVLVGGIRRVREAGGDVVVCSDLGHVRRVLETVGFTHVVPLVASVDDAQRMLTERATPFCARRLTKDSDDHGTRRHVASMSMT